MFDMLRKKTAFYRKIFIQTFCLIILICTLPKSFGVKKQFFSMEHPKIISYDRDQFKGLVMKSWRRARSNPVYYVDLNVTILNTLTNNYKMTLSYYQLLSNVYKPSFVEVSMGFCDILKKDVLISPAFIEAYKKMPKESRPIPKFECPILPGFYSFMGMVVPIQNIPTAFPFKNGRLYGNMTLNKKLVATETGFDEFLKCGLHSIIRKVNPEETRIVDDFTKH